jgi:hypothetical protein
MLATEAHATPTLALLIITKCITVKMPINFLLECLLQVSKEMVACNTHLGPINFCKKTATITQKQRVFLMASLPFQSCCNIPNTYTIRLFAVL